MTDDERYIIERFEDETTGVECVACGSDMDWQECDQCGGEGSFDWETLQELDPLWYQPGDTKDCEQCSGNGGWWICLACCAAPDDDP